VLIAINFYKFEVMFYMQFVPEIVKTILVISFIFNRINLYMAALRQSKM